MSKDKCCVPETILPSGIGGVEFKDGAIVTAGDLNRATEYPVQLLKRFIKGFFGCGVVKGLEVSSKDKKSLKIEVAAGVAIDANGFPLELVRETQVDLSCLRCVEAGEKGKTYTVAISYSRGDQANTGEQCGVVTNSGNSEGVKIAVFDAGCEPSGLCKKEVKDKQPENSACPPCSADDASESWVPVWCVKVVEVGEGDNKILALEIPSEEKAKSDGCRLVSCFTGCSKPEEAEESDLTVLARIKEIDKRLGKAEIITKLLEKEKSYSAFKEEREKILGS